MSTITTARRLALLLALLSLCSRAPAQPPLPPLGQRWVMNERFSDEFNGSELDRTKWFDHHPTWAGRAPGIFLSSQVAVADGYLVLRGKKLDRDTVITGKNGGSETFNIAGAAVVSRTTDAGFGYYECRVKPAATRMSTTFWLSSRRRHPGPFDCPADDYSLELDIQECIGRTGAEFEGEWFARGMHANGHFWYTDCFGERHDIRAPDVRFPNDELESADFHTYGGWWRDANTALFYYDGSEGPQEMKFYDGILDKPFNQTMGLNLVHETYPFPWIPLPTDAELADDDRNACYYDWVRSYVLVPAERATAPGRGRNLPLVYEENVALRPGSLRRDAEDRLIFDFTYQANADRELRILLLDEAGNEVESGLRPAPAGYAHQRYGLAAPTVGRLELRLESGGALLHSVTAPLPPSFSHLPTPPAGMHWELIPEFSDEFNGPALDSSVWHARSPYWVHGRPPATFRARTVSVADGKLVIRNEPLNEPGDETYSIAGGAVASVSKSAYHGYYSTRMRASELTMSSTFWLKNKPEPGDPCPHERQELDVVEAVGVQKRGGDFHNFMKSNTHIFRENCDGTREVLSRGDRAPLAPPAHEAYHTYAAWWQNDTTVHYYLDDERVFTVHPKSPFDRPMFMHLVTETYNWETPPTVEELADDSKNATYYDWVRSWRLVEND